MACYAADMLPSLSLVSSRRSLPVLLLGHVRDPGLAAVVTVEVRGHEDPGTADRRLFPQARHLVVAINLVELEDGELHLLVLVRDLLRLRVHLLLALLRAAIEARSEEDSCLMTPGTAV